MPGANLNTLQQLLSRNVLAARMSKGLSQEALALSADVDRTYVSQIERAIGNPSLLVLVKTASALDVSVPELLSDAA